VQGIRIGTRVPARTIRIDQALIRRERAVLAHDSTRQVEGLLLKTLQPVPSASLRMTPDGLGYSRTGDTIWLSKSEVVSWAAASVAAIVAVLIALGVPGATADLMVAASSPRSSERCSWHAAHGSPTTTRGHGDITAADRRQSSTEQRRVTRVSITLRFAPR
jgi:hypothetical protein